VSFALGRREAAAAGLKRRLEVEIAAAGEALADPATAAEARIHAARRRLKRARSILVALEDVLGRAGRQARRRLRDIARMLAGSRDADVLAAAAASLRDAAGPDERPALARLAASLAARAAAAHAAAAPLAAVAAALAEAETVVADTALPGKRGRRGDAGRDLLAEALFDAYKAGRKAMAAALASPEDARLHAWRKAVKHRWHLSRLAERRLAGTDRTTVNRLDRLAETLGQEHDLALLAVVVAQAPELTGGAEAAGRVAALVERRRQMLAEAAFALGSALYRDKPKRFRAGLATLPEAG